MKDVVVYVTACHGYSERRACALTRQARSTQRKPSVRDPRTAMRLRMHEIAQTRIRYGYRRVHIMLKREGWNGGRNLVYRLYREEGLVLRRRRPRRRKTAVNREARHRVQGLNEAWSLDFVHDQLSNGQSFRALTIIDIYSREALAIEVGQRLRGEHVVMVLNRLVQQRGAPRYLFADNELSEKARAASEYTSAVARRASNSDYESAIGKQAMHRRGSLRAGAPSRVRSQSSPADAALDRRRHNG
jgi:putative transposase